MAFLIQFGLCPYKLQDVTDQSVGVSLVCLSSCGNVVVQGREGENARRGMIM